MKLNLGCNEHRLEGYINADIALFDAVDVQCDALKTPFPNGSIEEIYMGHTLEHFQSPMDAFLECHRILEDKGILVVVVPDLTTWPETDGHITVGILYGFWFNDQNLPDRDVPTAMHRTWWNRDLLIAMGTLMGFDFYEDVDPWEDEHLVIGADWHVGVTFRKVTLQSHMVEGNYLYRKILGRLQ